MVLDPKLAQILSSLCEDIGKAYFVATFITPSLSGLSLGWELVLVLTQGLTGVTIAILLSWQFAKLGEEK